MRLFFPAALAALTRATKCSEADLHILSGKAIQERTDSLVKRNVLRNGVDEGFLNVPMMFERVKERCLLSVVFIQLSVCPRSTLKREGPSSTNLVAQRHHRSVICPQLSATPSPQTSLENRTGRQRAARPQPRIRLSMPVLGIANVVGHDHCHNSSPSPPFVPHYFLPYPR